MLSGAPTIFLAGPAPASPGGAGAWWGLALLVAGPLAAVLVLWRRWYRLDDAPPRRLLVSPTGGFAFFLGMLFAGMAGAEIARRALFGAEDAGDIAGLPMNEHAIILAAHCAGQAVVAVAYFVFARRGGPPRGSRSGAAILGALAFVVAWPMVACAARVGGLVVSLIQGQPVEPVAHDTLQQLVDAEPDRWFSLMAVLVVGAVPVLEEVMYRGMLQELLRGLDFGRWAAIVIASVLFAAMHAGTAAAHALPALFILSLGFGWAYEKSGRLTAPIVMHVLFNAVNLALGSVSQGGG